MTRGKSVGCSDHNVEEDAVPAPPEDRPSITREDVALHAGVSTAVVSYVVNSGPRNVAPAPDPRLVEAVDVVRAARRSDGKWVQAAPLTGRTWFDVDAQEGEPSRWLTLIGSRVLDWWDTDH